MKMTVARVIMMAFVAATLIHVASAIAGQATFFTFSGPGACLVDVDPSTLIAAVNEPLWANRQACGKRYRIRCTDSGPGVCRNGEITVTIADRCLACAPNEFDLSERAFSMIATGAGRINIDYNQA